jgi:hypothetical protein
VKPNMPVKTVAASDLEPTEPAVPTAGATPK